MPTQRGQCNGKNVLLTSLTRQGGHAGHHGKARVSVLGVRGAGAGARGKPRPESLLGEGVSQGNYLGLSCIHSGRF